MAQELTEILAELIERVQAVMDAIIEIAVSTARLIARYLAAPMLSIVSLWYSTRKYRYILSLDRRGRIRKSKYYYYDGFH